MSKQQGKKSSFCQDGGCVEAVLVSDDQVQLTDRLGNTVIYDRAEWEAFIEGVKAGEFDWDQLVSDSDGE